MTLRDIKTTARARLFDKMKVETLCYTSGPLGGSDTVYARVNSKNEAVGDLAGTSLAYAERSETIPKLIFLAADHIPKRGYVYVVDEHEAYRVDSTEPRDTITITAACSRLSSSELASYTPPGG